MVQHIFHIYVTVTGIPGGVYASAPALPVFYAWHDTP